MRAAILDRVEPLALDVEALRGEEVAWRLNGKRGEGRRTR
jgi:hypothetical protein